MSDTMIVFDRHLVRRRRDKAAAHFAGVDFLIRESGARLADRLLDVTRSFPRALDLGCHTGQMAALVAGHPRLGQVFQADVSPAMARRARDAADVPTFVADEEFLPVAPASLDLVMSNLSLHWVNDLPGALAQVRRTLRPDGLFLATLFGMETLRELRTVLLEADSDISGGVTPRISPFVDVRDAGNLLTRAGFTLPVADVDTITVTYENIFKLIADLRGMGETNAVLERQKTFTRRALFMRAAEIYAARFPAPGNRIAATFQLVSLTAWAPHESQQKPLRRGSAQARLADALNSIEQSAGETAPHPIKPDAKPQ
jgi:SAM-dependent methyltransferase